MKKYIYNCRYTFFPGQAKMGGCLHTEADHLHMMMIKNLSITIGSITLLKPMYSHESLLDYYVHMVLCFRASQAKQIQIFPKITNQHCIQL